MDIVVIANKKGGVGKTTTTQNVAAAMAMLGKTALAIDMDAQGNLTRSFGVTPEKSVLDVLRGTATWQDITVTFKNSDSGGCVLLAPANRQLAALPEIFSQEFGKELLLKEALGTIKGKLDMVLIDSPPALDLLAINTYAAATHMLIPVQCEFYALEGLALMMDDLQRVRQRLNPGLKVLGIVPTFVDKRKRLCRDVLAVLNKQHGAQVTNAAIRDNVALAEAPSNGESIFQYDGKAYGAQDYLALANELVQRLENQHGA